MPAYERSREVRHAVGEHGDVSLRSVAGPIRVRGIDGAEARVVLRYALRAPDDAAAARIEEEFIARLERGDGRLAATTADSRHAVIDVPGPLGALARAFGVAGDRSMELEAEVPHGAAVSVETVSGDVVAEGLDGRQRYHTLSGAVTLGCSGELRVETTSGDTRVDAPAPTGLEWHSVSSRVRATAPVWTSVRLDTMSGDAWLAGRLAAGPDHQARSVSGDVRLAGAGGVLIETRSVSGTVRSEVEHRIEGRAGRNSVVVGDGSSRLSFESMSGDLLVLRPVDTAAPGDPFDQLAVLRALERGEIDVDEAMRRMEGSGRA